MCSLVSSRLHPLMIERWLQHWCLQNHSTHYTNFLQPPKQGFIMEVLPLIKRHITILPTKNSNTLNPITIIIHSITIIKFLIDWFQIIHSYYSSISHAPSTSHTTSPLTPKISCLAPHEQPHPLNGYAMAKPTP